MRDGYRRIYFDRAELEMGQVPIEQPTASGTSSVTEADDTLAATAALKIQATESSTEANDTLAATGTIKIQATASITEAGDTLAATGALKIQATASITEDADTVSSTAALKIQATESSTEADDTAAATAALKIQGTSSPTESDDTVAATAAVAIHGTASITEADDTLSAEATISGTIVDNVITPTGGWLMRPRRESEEEKRAWDGIEPIAKQIAQIKTSKAPQPINLAQLEYELQQKFDEFYRSIQAKNALASQQEQLRTMLILEGVRKRIAKIEEQYRLAALAQEADRLENIRREEEDIVFVISMLAA